MDTTLPEHNDLWAELETPLPGGRAAKTTIADFIDIAPPTDQEMRRYHSEPEFHARVYAAKSRLHAAAEPIKRRMTGIRVRDYSNRDAFSTRLFWLALRIVIEQESMIFQTGGDQ